MSLSYYLALLIQTDRRHSMAIPLVNPIEIRFLVLLIGTTPWISHLAGIGSLHTLCNYNVVQRASAARVHGIDREVVLRE